MCTHVHGRVAAWITKVAIMSTMACTSPKLPTGPVPT